MIDDIHRKKEDCQVCKDIRGCGGYERRANVDAPPRYHRVPYLLSGRTSGDFGNRVCEIEKHSGPEHSVDCIEDGTLSRCHEDSQVLQEDRDFDKDDTGTI